MLEVEAMNDDAETLMEDYKAYKNKSTREVITELVELMDEEGYIEKDEKGKDRILILKSNTVLQCHRSISRRYHNRIKRCL